MKVLCPSIQRIMHASLPILLIHGFTVYAAATTTTTTMTLERTLEKDAPTLSWPNLDIAVHKNGFFGIDRDGRVSSVNSATGNVEVMEQIKESAYRIQCNANGKVLAVETFKGTIVHTFGKDAPVVLESRMNAIVSSDGEVILTTTQAPLNKSFLIIAILVAIGLLLLDQKYYSILPILLYIWTSTCKTLRAYNSTGELLLEHNSKVGRLSSVPSDLERTIVIDRWIPFRCALLNPRRRGTSPTNFTGLESSKNKHSTLYTTRTERRQLLETLTPGGTQQMIKIPRIPRSAHVLKVMDDGSVWYTSGNAVWLQNWEDGVTKKFDIHGKLFKSSDNSTLVDALWDPQTQRYVLTFHYI